MEQLHRTALQNGIPSLYHYQTFNAEYLGINSGIHEALNKSAGLIDINARISIGYDSVRNGWRLSAIADLRRALTAIVKIITKIDERGDVI